MPQGSEESAPTTRHCVAPSGILEGAPSIEPEILSGLPESLNDWMIRQCQSRFNANWIWSVYHAPCRIDCVFVFAPDRLGFVERYSCATCLAHVPEAVIFVLQSMNAWDRMKAYHYRLAYFRTASVLTRRCSRKDRYLRDFYRAVGIGPL